jgi:tol-pal system protein YbgF
MFCFLHQEHLHKLTIGPLRRLLAVSLIGFGLTRATLPPIVDIYQTPSKLIEIERLHAEIQSLKQQLEKASAEIVEQAHLIEQLQPTHKPNQKPFTRLFQSKSAQPKKTTPLPSRADTLAEKSWENALKLLKKRQYTKAMNAFEKFIKKNPTHANQSSAQYFLGQLALLKGDPAQSLHYFKIFSDRYPEDILIPDAQFQMGLAHYAQQNNAIAYKIFTQLEQRYPEHPVAKQARDHLKQLNLKAVNNP